MTTVKVWVDGISDTTARSALPTLARVAVDRSIEIGAEVLTDNIRRFSAQFVGLLDGTPLEGGTAVIEEVELSLTITANGGIELLGKVNVGAQAAVKVKLKRAQ